MDIWTEILRPKNLSELLVSRETREQILNWVKSWEDGVPVKKGLILWGDPGCGKTSTAYAIAGEKNWNILEINSSDYRNETFLKETAGMYSLYSDITMFNEKNQNADQLKLILIDEADNIFERASSGKSKGDGNEIGGYRAIIDILKTTRSPIIITMNDFWDFRRKSTGKDIISKCEVVQVFVYKRKNDLDYKAAVKKLTDDLMALCAKYNFRADRSAIEEIIREDLPDMRSAINDVERYVLSGSGSDPVGSLRDVHGQIFDVVRSLLKGNDISANLRLIRDIDVDKDTLIQWVSTNGVKECNTMDAVLNIEDLVSRADLLSRKASRMNYYRLWIYVDDIVASSFTAVDKKGGYTKYEFPNYITAMSKSKKSRNAIDRVCRAMELAFHLSYGDAIEMRPYFRELSRGLKNAETQISQYLNERAEENLKDSMLPEKKKKYEPVTPEDMSLYLS